MFIKWNGLVWRCSRPRGLKGREWVFISRGKNEVYRLSYCAITGKGNLTPQQVEAIRKAVWEV